MSKDRAYEVGYGKPPVKSQFKLGHSGNPRGRPAEKPDLTTQIGKKLASKRSVVVSGVRVKLPIAEILLEKLIERAAKGDVKTLLFLLTEGQKYREVQANRKTTEWRRYSKQEIAEMTEQERTDLYMKIVKGLR
ncbi:MAG: DUF5681 domain-containing protein [Afipia sp.]